MSRFFFLPSTVTLGLFVLLVYSLTHFSFGTNFFIVILVVLTGYIFRRGKVEFQETDRPKGELFLTPVFGRVKSIRKSVTSFNQETRGHEIRITISGFDQKGLYLPTSGEVNYLKANIGVSIPRDSENYAFYRPVEELAHTDLILASKNGMKSLLRFVDCKNGVRPNIWLKSGDRGRAAACFGYYPFGGTLIVYIPENSDVLVYENEQVVPGQTVLAAIKEVV